MKYNGFEVPDNEIDKLVDALEISIADACELWLADNGKITNEEQEKANKQAESAPRRYEHSTNSRKKVKKERKVDYNKADLLQIIKDALFNDENVVITGQKTETELYFSYFDEKYTVKLTKHRPKK
jgi:hypothetical protein